MAQGKYSPTVSHWYDQNQNWHRGIRLPGSELDPEGFDSYGYNPAGKDRAGYTEDQYRGDDELYDRIWTEWLDKPVPDEAQCLVQKQVREDMAAIQEEAELLLVAAAMYTHEDKQRLVCALRMLRGVPNTGMRIVEGDE